MKIATLSEGIKILSINEKYVFINRGLFRYDKNLVCRMCYFDQDDVYDCDILSWKEVTNSLWRPSSYDTCVPYSFGFHVTGRVNDSLFLSSYIKYNI